EVETLRTELHRRRSRLTSLEEIQQRYEGFQRGTRAVMQRAEDIVPGEGAIRGVVADVVRAPEQLEGAVEAGLGDRLGGVLGDRLSEVERRGAQRVRAARDAVGGAGAGGAESVLSF